MSPSPKRFLYLNLLVVLLFGAEGFSQDTFSGEAHSVIQLKSDSPKLYHASFKVFKYNFTGLIVFKYLSEEEGTRIVFLSETGLSIAEYSYSNKEVICHKTMPMVDRKSAKKYFSKIIEMVLTPGDCEKIKHKQIDSNTATICKGKNGKHYYIYNSKNLQEIWYKKGLCRKSVGFCNDELYTEKVLIKRRNKVLVQMKIVNNAIK